MGLILRKCSVTSAESKGRQKIWNNEKIRSEKNNKKKLKYKTKERKYRNGRKSREENYCWLKVVGEKFINNIYPRPGEEYSKDIKSLQHTDKPRKLWNMRDPEVMFTWLERTELIRNALKSPFQDLAAISHKWREVEVPPVRFSGNSNTFLKISNSQLNFRCYDAKPILRK